MAPTQKAAEHAEKVVDASVEKWDSYVSELGRAEGEFLGGGAEALGLHGAPENGATWSLMNGIHPVTGERFHRPYWTKVIERLVEDENGRIKKLVSAPSYAAVFAAPKSVSLLLATGYRDDGLEAHRFGVAEAARFLDSHWQVRDRSGAHPSLGLIATSYEHHTPRLLDPEFHLHTHLTIMNFGQRASDGKWLAGDYAHFLRLQKAAGIVYQAATRAELARRIPGIEFEMHDNGTADIAQIPAEVRERFSTRHAQVIAEDRDAADRGVAPGLKRIDYATYKTRSHKDVLDPRVWTEQQRMALAEVGVDDEAIAAWADQERTVVQASWEVRREELADRLFGPEGLTEKSNTFNRWAVLEQVGMAHYTDMESFEQLVARTDELLADPRVIAVGEHGRYGVKELDEKEKSVLEMQRHARPRAAARSSRRAIVRDMLTAAELRQGWVFNAGQRAMIERIATSGERVEVVEAFAGSGKTRSLGMLAEILEADGVHVIGAAPTGRARLELIQEAGIEDSHTLASLKVRRENGEQIFDRSRPFALAVDEAGFSATREFADVFQDAIAAGGQIVMVGDSGQLGSVGAGGLFAAISREREADGRHVFRLAEVVRQRARGGGIDEEEVRALGTLHSGDAEDWVALRELRGQLHVHIGREGGVDGIEHAKNLYLAALERSDASGIYLLSADNTVRAEVNERVREALVERGLIVESGVIAGRRFAQGERVTLRHNDNAKNLANGMRATVLAVDEAAGTLTVAIDGRADRIETLDYDYVTGTTDNGIECVQGGYANTIHTSQGGTVNETIIVAAAQSLDKERGYVAASRAKHATHLVTWDGSAPEYLAEHELIDQEQLDEVRAQLIDALERSGVELSLTEQIAEAGEQLELQFDTAEGPRPRAGQDSEVELEASEKTTSAEAIDDPAPAQDAKAPREAAPEPGTHELEQVGDEERIAESEEAPPLETQQLQRSIAPEPEAVAQPSPYQQAIAAAGAERHRNLCALRDELETATRRREQVHRKFNAAHERAREAGELADALEDSFPTGYAMDPPRYTLDGYARVLDQLASATKPREVRELSERAAAGRKQLPVDTRALLDQATQAGTDEREVLARYRKSRAERDQLYTQCAQLWGPAHEGDQDRAVSVLDYTPGTTIGDETGMTRIRQIQDEIRAEEVALSALADPQRTIQDRLALALEINDIYKRPPANLQEANAWSNEWGHGIALEERNGTVAAVIYELPGWLHRLSDRQLDQVASALERGNRLGQQTMNIGLPPRQAIQEQQRGIDKGHGMGFLD